MILTACRNYIPNAPFCFYLIETISSQRFSKKSTLFILSLNFFTKAILFSTIIQRDTNSWTCLVVTSIVIEIFSILICSLVTILAYNLNISILQILPFFSLVFLGTFHRILEYQVNEGHV